MSTVLVNNFIPSVIDYFGKDSCVVSERENLADYVRRIRNEKGLSMAKVAERSGGLIAQSYFFKIENGLVKNVSIEKLRAIARGLGVSEEEVLGAARGKPLDEAQAFDSEVRVLFKGFEELPDSDKRELLASVRMLGSEVQRRRLKPPVDQGKRKKG